MSGRQEHAAPQPSEARDTGPTDAPPAQGAQSGTARGDARAGGVAHVYGDDVDTDRLFPGRYLFCVRDDEMREHALEDLDPAFRERVRPGDVVFGGRNFGCGSSREQAVACLRVSGVEAVVARSFARIYFRNAINNGIAPIVCPDAVDGVSSGDHVEVDVAAGLVRNHSRGTEHPFDPFPDFLREILDDGGLVPHLRRTRGGGSAANGAASSGGDRAAAGDDPASGERA